MPIFRKINKDFFKKWMPEMAYVLGFVYADGNIVHTKRNTWFWSIQITDKRILEDIKRAINSSHKISLKRKLVNHKQLYRLQVGSKEMCQDLLGFGLTPRKSLTVRFPNIHPQYFCHFLRGYFDGDGGVWSGLKNKKNKRRKYTISSYFTSGSKVFLESVKNELRKRGLKGGSLVIKERGFDLKYSVKDTLKLYKIMYNKRTRLFLVRKKNKFREYIDNICDRSSIG